MRVGYGTSGRNAGFMLRHHSHGSNKDLDAAKRSDRFFQTCQSYLRYIVEQHKIRCDWSDWGQIYVSASAPRNPIATTARTGSTHSVSPTRH